MCSMGTLYQMIKGRREGGIPEPFPLPTCPVSFLIRNWAYFYKLSEILLVKRTPLQQRTFHLYVHISFLVLLLLLYLVELDQAQPYLDCTSHNGFYSHTLRLVGPPEFPPDCLAPAHNCPCPCPCCPLLDKTVVTSSRPPHGQVKNKPFAAAPTSRINT